MVLPLYESLAQLLPDIEEVCFPNIKAVHEHFDTILHPNKGAGEDTQGDLEMESVADKKTLRGTIGTIFGASQRSQKHQHPMSNNPLTNALQKGSAFVKSRNAGRRGGIGDKGGEGPQAAV